MKILADLIDGKNVVINFEDVFKYFENYFGNNGSETKTQKTQCLTQNTTQNTIVLINLC